MKHWVLLLALLTGFSGCTPRKPAEEGRVRLDSIEQQWLYTKTEKEKYYRMLLETEDRYDLTPEQVIRAKLIKSEVLGYGLPGDKQPAVELLNEAEGLALRLGNDTLLRRVRRNLMIYYCNANDSTAACGLIREELPDGAAHGKEKDAVFLYGCIARMYEECEQAGQAIGWYERMRSYLLAVPTGWYVQMAELCLEDGRYEEAILYADSAILRLTPGNAVAAPYSTRAKALGKIGKNGEALDCYTQVEAQIDNELRRNPTRKYSADECELFYNHARLLYQQQDFTAAIPLLQRVVERSVITPESEGAYARNDFPTVYLGAHQLLAACYTESRQPEKAGHINRMIDSLHVRMARQNEEIDHRRNQEEYQNITLAYQLQQLEADRTRAHRWQYLLYGCIVLLLAVIVKGIVWWRNKRRRLRQLFDLLMLRHAAWQEMLTQLPTHSESQSETFVSSDASSQSASSASSASVKPNPTVEAYRRLFRQVLDLMESEQLYLDPGFDLVSLARHLGTNRTYLSTALHHQTGMNFSNWLAEYRVNHLIVLLYKNPDESIDRLYPQCGFASRSTCFRQFRQVTNLTPKEFMKQMF